MVPARFAAGHIELERDGVVLGAGNCNDLGLGRLLADLGDRSCLVSALAFRKQAAWRRINTAG